jgi:hypothetical protein
MDEERRPSGRVNKMKPKQFFDNSPELLGVRLPDLSMRSIYQFIVEVDVMIRLQTCETLRLSNRYTNLRGY